MADKKDELIEKAKEAVKNIDKEDVKKVVNKALDSGAADKVIDKVEKKIGKDIDKKDIKDGVNKILK